MQSKISPSDEYFMSCYYDIFRGTDVLTEGSLGGPSQKVPGFQICYNLRYFERHGRERQDPWSCRQSVIYQRYNFATTASSAWIVVQAPERLKTTLDDVGIHCLQNPLFFHIRILDAAVANNWEYIEYLSDQLLNLDKQAAFPRALHQFDIDISRSQEAHSIKKRLFHMKTLLNGTIRIISALSSLAKELLESEKITKSTHDIVIRHLGNISRDLEAHKSMTDELLDWSCIIQSMINSILDFRNQESLKENGVQLKVVAQANRDEAQASAKEARHVAEIARHTYADSRIMRIATVIALIYLPASLVMAFFSTVFVEIRRDSNDPDPSDTSTQKHRVFISNTIWIAFASIVALIFITVGIFIFWQKKTDSKGGNSTTGTPKPMV
ncbi:hypothetical protein TWF730_002802 [Orbilia blumenaviensis]|uniref:CorA-like transporter domain-containing protein n=1 Tax=Orbilia blumenaviensis TaxID=1796055 RepID=A0AAV9UB49_9PEZI